MTVQDMVLHLRLKAMGLAQVLSLLAQGFANEEIGVTLGLETSTVKHHINAGANGLRDYLFSISRTGS
jgi:FixJ family two-component response regulator